MYPIGWIGQYGLIFIVIYLTAKRLVFSYEKRVDCRIHERNDGELKYEDVTMKTAFLRYGLNALIVIIAVIFLPKIGEGRFRGGSFSGVYQAKN